MGMSVLKVSEKTKNQVLGVSEISVSCWIIKYPINIISFMMENPSWNTEIYGHVIPKCLVYLLCISIIVVSFFILFDGIELLSEK